MRSFVLLALLFPAALVTACAASGIDPAGGGGGGGDGTGTTITDPSGSGGAGGGTSSGVGGDVVEGTGGAPVEVGETLLYAHTGKELFAVDPKTNFGLTSLGAFDASCSTSAMVDFAVDQDQSLWGVTTTKAYPLSLGASSVSCGAAINLVSAGSSDTKFYGLTFAPKGVIDDAKEVLLGGNTAGQLWSIASNGQLTQRGTLGVVPANDGNGHSYANQGKNWQLSGDIVVLANGGDPLGYATARDCKTADQSSCGDNDTLLQLDVAKLKAGGTGSVVKAVRGMVMKRKTGCSDGWTGSYGHMYGIAALGDKVYGFSYEGAVVEIDVSDGSACLVKSYKDLYKFNGAGVTTLAKVTAPPK